MALERHIICKPDEVPEGEGKSFTVSGLKIALFKVDGEFYALEDRCTCPSDSRWEALSQNAGRKQKRNLLLVTSALWQPNNQTQSIKK